MKLKKVISLLLALTMVFTMMSVAMTVSANEDACDIAIVADTDTTALDAGDIFTVSVKVSNIVCGELRGAQVFVAFDPAVLQIVDESGTATTKPAQGLIYNKADFYNEDTETGYGKAVGPAIYAEQGLVTYSLAKAAESTETSIAVNDSYTLFQIRFKALKKDLTGLKFANPADYQTPSFAAGYKVNCAFLESLAGVTDKTAKEIRVGKIQATVTSINNPADIRVGIGTSEDDLPLPTGVSVNYSDSQGSGNTTMIPEGWTCADYDGDTVGTYVFTADSLTPESSLSAYEFDFDGKVAQVNVIVEKINLPGEALISPMMIYVPYNITKEQLELYRPAQGIAAVWVDQEHYALLNYEIDYSNYDPGLGDHNYEKDVTWDLQGKYTIDGVETELCDYVIKMDAEVTQETPATLERGSYPTEPVGAPATIFTKEEFMQKQFGSLSVGLLNTQDGSYHTWIDWEAPAGFDPSVPGIYTFTGTVRPQENLTLDPEDTTIEVEIQILGKVIQSVASGSVEDQTITLVDKTTTPSSSTALTSLYPAYLAATYTDETQGSVLINWDEESRALTAAKNGVYTLKGTTAAYDEDGNFVIPRDVVAKVTVSSSGSPVGPVGGNLKIYYNDNEVEKINIIQDQAVVLSASESKVVWSSANPSIARITEDGLLIALTPGLTTVTAVSANGEIATITVDVSINTNRLNIYDENYPNPFEDMEADEWEWAKQKTATMAGKKVIYGKTETEYAPADNITRAEFAALLVRAYNLTATSDGKEFTDVAPTDWFYDTVKIASALNIVSGYENGAFDPNASITREDMAVMALAAVKAAGRTLPEKQTLTFTDADQIDGYALNAVTALANAGIINGMGDGRFAPLENANRAQAAVIIYNLYNL